jgi:ribosomal protein S18 acetylase RimI-like enzyme
MTDKAMTIQLRRGTNTDLDALAALSRRNIIEIYTSFLGKAAVDSYLQCGAVEHYLAENLVHSTVLVEDGTIVGYAVSKQNLIDLMMIDLPYQRSGLGTALLRHMEDVLFQTHQSIRLESFKENSAANSFYRKNGWVEIRQFLDEDSGVEKVEFHKSSRLD